MNINEQEELEEQMQRARLRQKRAYARLLELRVAQAARDMEPRGKSRELCVSILEILDSLCQRIQELEAAYEFFHLTVYSKIRLCPRD